MVRFLLIFLVCGGVYIWWVTSGRKIGGRELVFLVIALVLFVSLLIYFGFDQSGSSLS